MFSARVLERFNNPKTAGPLPDADTVGMAGLPGEGPYMAIYLRRQSGKISAARFDTYGCPAAIACGSWLTEWVCGKDRETALRIEPCDLAVMLGGLPLGKEHCAVMAISALRKALEE